jgi:hypothetical protein
MEVLKKILKTIGKYTVYCFVFMVNPKAVIFREVDDEMEAEEKKAEAEKAKA